MLIFDYDEEYKEMELDRNRNVVCLRHPKQIISILWLLHKVAIALYYMYLQVSDFSFPLASIIHECAVHY